MSDEEIEKLKARVSALETMVITGTSGNQYQAVKAVTDEPNREELDRVGRIAAIIWKELNDAKVVISGNGDFAMSNGIRKALNEFYTGPYEPVDERIKAMRVQLDMVENDLRVALSDIDNLRKGNAVLSDRLAIVRIALDTTEPAEEIFAMQTR